MLSGDFMKVNLVVRIVKSNNYLSFLFEQWLYHARSKIIIIKILQKDASLIFSFFWFVNGY